jgi:hypothetical protein
VAEVNRRRGKGSNGGVREWVGLIVTPLLCADQHEKREEERRGEERDENETSTEE